MLSVLERALYIVGGLIFVLAILILFITIVGIAYGLLVNSFA